MDRSVPSGGGAMETAFSSANLDILSAAGELEASWVAQPIELIDRRGQPPLGMEDPGGQVVATLLGQIVQHAGAERGLLLVQRSHETRIEAEATMHPDRIVVRHLDALVGPPDLP